MSNEQRAFTDSDIEDLKRKMKDRIRQGKPLANVEYDKLDVANLRVHLDDLWYCIEWHNRFWPEDYKKKIGF